MHEAWVVAEGFRTGTICKGASLIQRNSLLFLGVFMVRFSVIIPCFNVEQFIAFTLESIDTQTLHPYEIIVVDDGSTDGGLDIIKNSPVSVRILQTSRQGGAGARNVGIREATGDWLAFLDADDMWYPNHLASAAKFIERYDPVGYINHYDHMTMDNEIVIRPNTREDSVVIGSGLDEYLNHFRKYRHFVGMSACMVNRDRALAVGGLDEDQVRRHDIEFWFRVIDGQRWIFDSATTSAYRKNRPDSLSENFAEASYYGFQAFFKHKEKFSDRLVYGKLLQKRARSALTNSLMTGDLHLIDRAYTTAFEHLNLRHKFVIKFLYRYPAATRTFRSLRLI